MADVLRPTTLNDVVGQDHVLAEGTPLRRMLSAGRFASVILWGPPGVGKTTIARLLAGGPQTDFVQLSAIFSGVADLRKAFADAEKRAQAGRQTVLFVDEIHRFNRAQQDSFLPVMERGVITLIGATTENPSFALNAALMSRAQVVTLRRLTDEALEMLLEKAADHMGRSLPLDAASRSALMAMADGDGRFLLGLTEQIFAATPEGTVLDPAGLAEVAQRRVPVYDAAQEGHYNLASALQKSIRGSDTDAALYWTARMLQAGEDPRFVLRRLTVIASEDVGNADPAALPLVIAARQAFEALGDPEGHHAIGQAVAYLASAPKSNAAYAALKKAKRAAKEHGSLMPPKHALNAPTAMMKNEGYSDGYIYDHDTPDGFAGLDYFPDDLPREAFYQPTSRGAEKLIKERLAWFAARRGQKR